MKQKVSPLIREQLTLNDKGNFTLLRRTRAGVPNANGYTYTKDAFDEAIRRYVKEKNSGLYLAPVSFSESSFDSYDGKDKTKLTIKVNTEVYGKFNKSMPQSEYQKFRVADIVNYDDYTITFKKISMIPEIESFFSKYVNDDTMVQMRYNADIHKGIVTEMRIICFDLSVIPYNELGIDIKKICNGI